MTRRMRTNRKTKGKFVVPDTLDSAALRTYARASYDEYSARLDSAENSTPEAIKAILDEVRECDELSSAQKSRLYSLANERLRDLEL